MYRDLLKIPYEYGRMDCVILAQEVFRRHGLKVPVYEAVRTAIDSIDSHSEKDRLILDVIESTWVPIKRPRVPCLVVIPNSGFFSHIGVYIGKNRFIHVSSMRKYPTIEKLDNPLYANRKYYTFNGS